VAGTISGFQPDQNAMDIDKYVKEHKPKNIEELYITIQEGWNSISANRCARLIESMPRRCAALIRNNDLHYKNINQILYQILTCHNYE